MEPVGYRLTAYVIVLSGGEWIGHRDAAWKMVATYTSDETRQP